MFVTKNWSLIIRDTEIWEGFVGTTFVVATLIFILSRAFYVCYLKSLLQDIFSYSSLN